jgi:hypothetical protein
VAWLRPGTVVPARDVRSTVQLGAGTAAGLADRGTVLGFAYPALSRDGGRSWRIDGPQFSHAGADGAGATSRLLAAGNGTLIAWGPTGNLVKVTSDRGQHWFQAVFPRGVHSVLVAGTTLVVRALGDQLPRGSETGQFATWRYTSTDGGRHWHRTKAAEPVRF